jgi:hypothetical protein
LTRQALVKGLTYLEAIEKSAMQKSTLVFSLTLLVETGFVLSRCKKIVIKQEENCLEMFFKGNLIRIFGIDSRRKKVLKKTTLDRSFVSQKKWLQPPRMSTLFTSYSDNNL